MRRLGAKVYSRTLGSFAADLRALPLNLDCQLQGGERDRLRRELLTLKGLAATVSVAGVCAAFRLGVEFLEALCAALHGGLEVPHAGAAAAPLTPAETALLAGLLRSVQGLLQASDLDAAEALQNLRA